VPKPQRHAEHAIDRRHPGAQMFGEFKVPPFIEQMQVDVAK